VIAAITVALSIGIVFASIPYLPHPPGPHGTIQTPISRLVNSGNVTHPGYFALLLPGVSNNESFAVGVTVVGGTASFCVLQQPTYDNWKSSYSTYSDPGNAFPSSACIPQEQTGISHAVLSFNPPSSGNYDVAALNTNPQGVTVTYSPA